MVFILSKDDPRSETEILEAEQRALATKVIYAGFSGEDDPVDRDRLEALSEELRTRNAFGAGKFHDSHRFDGARGGTVERTFLMCKFCGCSDRTGEGIRLLHGPCSGSWAVRDELERLMHRKKKNDVRIHVIQRIIEKTATARQRAENKRLWGEARKIIGEEMTGKIRPLKRFVHRFWGWGLCLLILGICGYGIIGDQPQPSVAAAMIAQNIDEHPEEWVLSSRLMTNERRNIMVVLADGPSPSPLTASIGGRHLPGLEKWSMWATDEQIVVNEAAQRWIRQHRREQEEQKARALTEAERQAISVLQ